MLNQELYREILLEYAGYKEAGRVGVSEFVVWFFAISRFLNGKPASIPELNSSWESYLAFKLGYNKPETNNFNNP